MGLFSKKQKSKTWQELKEEEEIELERIKVEQEKIESIRLEKCKIEEFNKELDKKVPEIIQKHYGLSEIELKKELKKYPRCRRGRLRELYNQYQKGMVLMPGKDIDNKQYIIDMNQNG